MMGSYLRFLPVFLTLHSLLFALGLRLFFMLLQNKYTPPSVCEECSSLSFSLSYFSGIDVLK